MSEIQTEIPSEKKTDEIIVSTEMKNIIEALVFASDEPMTVRFLRSIMDDVNKDLPPGEQYTVNAEIIRKAVGDLNRGYGRMGTGFRIIEIAGGFTYATQEQFASWVGKLAKEKARRRLSPTAVETLSIIAYKQPIAKGELEFIRGVNVDYIINALLEKDLIHITGRANTPGRPLLYGTTQKFLEHFGLNELTDLPKPREISELINETELEVDRRILAEQQELEFREDLEKKMDGNEGSKNKPQRAAKVKVPEDIKAENRRGAQEESTGKNIPSTAEDKIIEEGERSSESNLDPNQVTAETEAGPTNGAVILENEPESPAVNDQDRLETNDSENQIHHPDLSGENQNLPSEDRQNPMIETGPENPTIVGRPEENEQDLPVSDLQNREIDLDRHQDLPIENERNEMMEDAAHPLEKPVFGEPEDQAHDRSTEKTTEESTGWSKWKNKVKTFFQKLFA